LIKALNKLGIEVYLKIIKVMCNKPIANIKVNEDKPKAFHIRSEARQGCVLSPLSIIRNASQGNQAIGSKKKKKRK
jgi:hypothetical protein